MLEHYRGNEEIVRRISDLMDRAQRQQRLLITPFLTPQELAVAKKVIGRQMEVYVDGGYEQAESCRLGICPYEVEADLEIVCLHASYNTMGKKLAHPDVLGALMHLGIERNQFGDILLKDEDIYIFVKADLANYIQQNLIRIARYALSFEVYEGEVAWTSEVHYVTKSVSALRLDCIVAACANVSRTKAEALIRGKLVKVNHMPLEDCKCLCHNNSTVSIRGYGRFVILTNGRTSKKGKQVIEIGKYM